MREHKNCHGSSLTAWGLRKQVYVQNLHVDDFAASIQSIQKTLTCQNRLTEAHEHEAK